MIVVALLVALLVTRPWWAPRARAWLLDPTRLTAAERDPYFLREYAMPPEVRAARAEAAGAKALARGVVVATVAGVALLAGWRVAALAAAGHALAALARARGAGIVVNPTEGIVP